MLALSQVVIPLITFPYVARVLLPSGIGQVAYVESIFRYGILISGLGMPIYGVREVAKAKGDKEKLDRLFSELFAVHFILTLIIIVFLWLIFIYIPGINNYFGFLFPGILLILSNVFLVEWYFQGIERFKFLAIRSLIVKLIFVALTFLTIKNEGDSVKYFFLGSLMLFVNALINFSVAVKSVTFYCRLNTLDLKKHLKPLILIFSSIALISGYTLFDTLVLGLLSNQETVGIYTAGIKLARIPVLLVGALGVVLIPKLSEYYFNNDVDEFNLLVGKSLNFIITISVPITLIIFSLSDELIVSFAGNNFLKSSDVLLILSGLSFFIGLSNVFGLQILTPLGLDKYFTYSVFFGFIVSLVGNFYLIPHYREIGAAISNMMAEVVVALATMYYASKLLSFQISWNFFIKVFLTSLPIYCLSKVFIYFFSNSYLIVFLTTFLGLLIFTYLQVKLVRNEFFVSFLIKIKSIYERV
jgi:O-antigen/teichoic acid export membrane protein